MVLNLNTAAGFAKLTLSTASSALTALTGASADKWDIEEGAYGHPADSGPRQKQEKNLLERFAANVVESLGFGGSGAPEGFVLFHVFKSSVEYHGAVDEITDEGGKRKVPFEFPYVDGQTTEDLGRKGERFTVNILLHGPTYMTAYKKLIKEFEDPKPGTMIHPVRGRLKCVAADWTTTHRSSERQAVALRVVFLEHNFDVAFDKVDDTTKSALAQAIGFLAKIANVVNKIDSNISVVQSFKNFAIAAAQQYQAAYQDNLVRINKSFNTGQSDDLPALIPTSTGASQTEFPTAISPNDAFTGVDETALETTTIAALAAQQAIDEVKALREQLNELIGTLSDVNDGQGSLIFYDEILDLKRSGIAIQNALELGIQSSNATILNYSVPRIMTLREVCFENGLSVDRAYELEKLNPSLLSTNKIDAGTVLKVPGQ